MVADSTLPPEDLNDRPWLLAGCRGSTNLAIPGACLSSRGTVSFGVWLIEDLRFVLVLRGEEVSPLRRVASDFVLRASSFAVTCRDARDDGARLEARR
jgi:hypothetical protein